MRLAASRSWAVLMLLSLSGCCTFGFGEGSAEPSAPAAAADAATTTAPVEAPAPEAAPPAAPEAPAAAPVAAPAPPAAPAAAAPAAAAPTSPTPNAALQFRLAAGQGAAVEGVRVTFESLLQDSRCPDKAQCVQAGEAVVSVTVKTAEREFHPELRTSAGADQLFFPGWALRLVDVVPRPREGVAPRPSEVSAVFVLARN